MKFHHQVGIGPVLHGGADLVRELLGVDDLLARDVPALLRRHLVLEVEPRDAGLLVLPHRAHDVERVAVARVGVGDERDADGGREVSRVIRHLGQPGETQIGESEPRGGRPVARHVDGGESRALDESGRDAVVGARHHESTACLDERAELAAAGHAAPPGGDAALYGSGPARSGYGSSTITVRLVVSAVPPAS